MVEVSLLMVSWANFVTKELWAQASACALFASFLRTYFVHFCPARPNRADLDIQKRRDKNHGIQ